MLAFDGVGNRFPNTRSCRRSVHFIQSSIAVPETTMHPLPKLLALAAACVAVWPAQAALTPTSVACDGQGTGMTSLTGYLDCSGAWAGNNLNQATDVANQILADWGLSGLSPLDITGGNAGPTGSLSFAAQ